MNISNFSKHIFWSYKENVNLPDEVVIQQVITYGEIEDIVKMVKIYNKEKILTNLEKIKKRYPKRYNFIKKVFL